jgi:hypothetical protein
MNAQKIAASAALPALAIVAFLACVPSGDDVDATALDILKQDDCHRIGFISHNEGPAEDIYKCNDGLRTYGEIMRRARRDAPTWWDKRKGGAA